jgi:hypothetical protein
MAPSECRLDSTQLAEQLDRYQRLGVTAENTEQNEFELVVSLTDPVDPGLLRETIEVESRCCSFFTVRYDAAGHRLSITVDDPGRRDALRQLHVALTSHEASIRGPRSR